MRYLGICLLLLCLSCSKPEATEESLHMSIQLVDSIQVDYVGAVNLMDVDPENGNVLLFDMKTRDFVLADFTGSVYQTFNKTGDGPDRFGNFPLSPGKFFSPDGFTVLSYLGVFQYGTDGEMISRLKFDQPALVTGKPSVEWQFFPKGADSILMIAAEVRGEYPNNTPEYYEHLKLFGWLDLRDGQISKFAHLEDNSVFKNGKGHDPSDILPVLDYEEGKLWTIVGKDMNLNVYEEKAPHALLQQFPLPLQGFQQDPGKPFQEIDPRMIAPNMSYGRVKNMKLFGDYVLISYFPGYDEADRETFQLTNTPEELGEFMKRAKEKYPHRLLVVDREGQKLADMEMPQALHEQQFIVRNGQLWFMGKPSEEKEEDFYKIFRVSLERQSFYN